MEPIVYIHADESCLGNQNVGRDSPGGAAVLLETWRDDRWQRRDAWTSEPATTNNRMAISSAMLGLGALKRPSRVVFVSDSSYLIKAMREWIHGWIRRGWKRKAGPVENRELWQALLPIARRHEIDWRWVRGHAGDPRNEYANDRAVEAAREQTSSGGLVPSGFEAWLEDQRERRERYFDFIEHAPPPEEEFRPAPRP